MECQMLSTYFFNTFNALIVRLMDCILMGQLQTIENVYAKDILVLFFFRQILLGTGIYFGGSHEAIRMTDLQK